MVEKGEGILGIIPARGGSKGLPGKNIKELHGKPLIAWTIEAGLDCELIDELIVNTDSDEIAEVARQHGGRVPFLRPAELAGDTASTIDVLRHTLQWYEERDRRFELVLLLQPTSPLRSAADIQGALRLFRDKKARAVVSVCPVEHHPHWSNQLPEDRCMAGFLRPQVINKPRQQLPKYYGLNGAIYLAAVDFLMAHGSFFGERTYAYVMDRERSVDIDTAMDFQLAELLLQGDQKI